MPTTIRLALGKLLGPMRWSGGAVITSLMLLRPALADDEARYRLEGGKIVVEQAGIFEDIAVDCDQTFSMVRHDGNLYVACGAQGIAVYSLAEPAHPVLVGRLESNPCVRLADDGTCAPSRVETTPVETASSHAPTTVREYDQRLRQLKGALVAARRTDPAAVHDTQKEIEELEGWARRNIHRRDPNVFAAGLVMCAVGAATVVAGIVTVVVPTYDSSVRYDTKNTVMATGGVLVVAGLVVTVAGIPIAVYGGRRLMNSPRATVLVGPGRLGLEATF